MLNIGHFSEPIAPSGLDAGLCRAAVDAMQEAVLVADRDGVIRLWNRGAEVLFGFSAEEAVGAGLELLVPDRFRRQHDEGYRHAIATGQMRTQGRVLTTRSNHKYGCRLYVAFTFGLLKDEHGQVQGVVAVGRDATASHLEKVANRLKGEAPGGCPVSDPRSGN
jgi:PAS domain S-box-containing protein